MLKRLFDIGFSLVALVLLFPLFLFIVVWIKLDSKGPVFFRQVRVGMNCENFRIFKFRTMVERNTPDMQLTVSGDERITSSGRFLRKYKLDELAQFINVLVGDMSVVGPRPEVPKYVEYYSEDDRKKIFSIKPGITDKASLEYRNENDLLDKSSEPEQTYIEDILPVKIRYYCEYVDSQSVIGDIYLIIRTFFAIFK